MADTRNNQNSDTRPGNFGSPGATPGGAPGGAGMSGPGMGRPGGPSGGPGMGGPGGGRFFGRPGGGPGGPGMMMGMPVEKPKDLWKTLKRIIIYLGTQKYALIALIIMVILSSLLSLIVPVLQKEAIDTVTIGESISIDFAKLTMNLIYMGILFAVISGITLVQGLLAAAVSQKTVKVMRTDMMNKLQKLRVVYFDRNTHGEIMSRLTNDVDNISMCVSQSISSLFSGVVVLLGSLCMMMYYSPLMTVISLAIVPAGIFVTKKITSKTRVFFRNQQNRLGELNGHIEIGRASCRERV